MTSKDNARATFMECVYRQAQNTPSSIAEFHVEPGEVRKGLCTAVVGLMDAAFEVALAETNEQRQKVSELEAENYALQDQVKGLQELMAQQSEVEACYEHAQKAMEGEADRLRAQLAEAQALLRDVLNSPAALGDSWLTGRIRAALSASAEPSAPRRAFGMNLVVGGNMPDDEMHLVGHEGEPIKLVVADGKARDA